MNRRFMLLTLGLLPASFKLRAQGSSETATLYVPFPPGGTSDVFARTMAPGLAKQLQRTVAVENLTGASGSMAVNKVLARGAAGDALFMGSPSETILAPATLKAAKYRPSDLRLIGLISRVPLVLLVKADLPVSSIDELVAHARANKDQPLSYGSVGVGSVYHLAGNDLMQAVGTTMNHIPYRGGAPLRQDLMGGQLDMAFLPADGNIAASLSNGKMRAIGVTSPKRSAVFPQVGTFSESASLPRFSTVDVWGGLFVPKALPEAAARTVHRAFYAALAEPEIRKTMDSVSGGTIAAALSLEELANFYNAETVRFEKAAKQANLELN